MLDEDRNSTSRAKLNARVMKAERTADVLGVGGPSDGGGRGVGNCELVRGLMQRHVPDRHHSGLSSSGEHRPVRTEGAVKRQRRNPTTPQHTLRSSGSWQARLSHEGSQDSSESNHRRGTMHAPCVERQRGRADVALGQRLGGVVRAPLAGRQLEPLRARVGVLRQHHGPDVPLLRAHCVLPAVRAPVQAPRVAQGSAGRELAPVEWVWADIKVSEGFIRR